MDDFGARTPPKSVKIGNIVYEIRVTDDIITDGGAIAFGRVSGWREEIEIHSKCSFTRMRESLIHEIVHAIESESGMSDGVILEDEEARVESWAKALLQFFRDNPKVVTWLQETQEYP